MSITSEHTFESSIIQSLVENGGYEEGNAGDYSPEIGMCKYEVLHWLKTSQPKRWSKLAAIHGDQVENKVLQRLYKELELRGALDVLRKGFVDYGTRFQMTYFRPASGMNPEAMALYEGNTLRVTRQVYFSRKDKKSVDLMLSLNGLPIATLELKNQFTGQNVTNALKQYSTTRDYRELLFAFNKRALVHFAVDSDSVFMTTRLDGDKTRWLPFNKGYNNGQGNPPNPEGYRTSYLWDDILAKDSIMEILQRFVHLQTDEIETNGKVYKKEKLIWPRYHQLDAVRRITTDCYGQGAGHNYLIQHSAGSGKSNSIAWLAYRLSSLHDSEDDRIFDAVIVITDRRILDKQLQNTIYQFEHKSGVVQKIDKNSTQLAEAIKSGTNIIITTLQKFPFVIDKVGDLPSRKYAVIIDEAHSSQGGEASKKLKEVLGATVEPGENADISTANEPYPKYGEGEEDEFTGSADMVGEYIEKSAKARGRQSNISFFAFTATPKYKTLEVFGHRGEDGKPKPFDLYSMRQAIEEGFILDVLQNYTTYSLYYKLTKAISDDPQLNRKKAAKAIGKFVSLHPFNLAQKTEIIIEHFREIVAKKIGGRAKAMVVCGSRLHAKRYYDKFAEYIRDKGYDNEVKILVAFSGKVEGVTEPELTGYSERELANVFDGEEYRILIVADKYQTGFDQPRLHTMYVDKKLSGVKAVQTLSRLNRMCPGKVDTFVLDFVNERQTILDSFQPYYEVTTVKEETDINHLYDLKAKLDTYQVYWEQEIEGFANIYFNPSIKLSHPSNQKKLYALTDPAVERYKGLDTDERRDEFKKAIRSWTNLYAFLAQIMPFTDDSFEKFYAYAKMLQTRLPKRDLADAVQLDDEVALEYYRLQKIKDGAIELEKGEEGELSGTLEAGLKRAKEEEALLSEIINVLNDRFGTEFEEADKLFFDQIEEELMNDETLKVQAKVNHIDSFKYVFNDKFVDKLIGRMDQNQEIFEKILEDTAFGDLVKMIMMNRVYKKMNE